MQDGVNYHHPFMSCVIFHKGAVLVATVYVLPTCRSDPRCFMHCSSHSHDAGDMVTTVDHRKGFVRRLVAACDDSQLIPPHGQGRQRMIAERTGVAQETVSKWFKGVAMPRPDPLQKLCDLLEAEPEWLVFGVRPPFDSAERRVQARESDGAVHLVWGYIALSGGHCGAPSVNDSRAAYVDMYATISGSVFPIYVSLAQSLSRGRYEFVVPKEYTEVRCIGVVPNEGHFDFLDLSTSMISEHRHRKGGNWTVEASRIDNSYIVGADKWRCIENFGEMR